VANNTQVGIFCLANSQRLHFLRHCKCQQISATAARQNHKAVLARLTTGRVEPSSQHFSLSISQCCNWQTKQMQWLAFVVIAVTCYLLPVACYLLDEANLNVCLHKVDNKQTCLSCRMPLNPSNATEEQQSIDKSFPLHLRPF